MTNTINDQRFCRNIGTIGETGQSLLLKSHVVIVGLGGIGGNILEQMARIGVREITGIDPDVFDESNLNRQLLSLVNNLTTAKVDQAEKRIREINTEIIFNGIRKRHSEVDNKLWGEADLVFDCLDNIADRLTLAEYCRANSKILIHGAIGGWYGQAAVIYPDKELLSKIYYNTDSGLEAEFGTPAFTAALTASFMVSLGVKVLCNIHEKDEDKVFYFDLEENLMTSISFNERNV